MYLDTETLKRRLSRFSDEELLNMVTTHRTEYRQVATDLASKELMQRNIPLPAINNPQLRVGHQPTCSKQPGPEKRSNDINIPWLKIAVPAVIYVITGRVIIIPLSHKYEVINNIIPVLGFSYIIYRLYNWYKS